MFLEHEP